MKLEEAEKAYKDATGQTNSIKTNAGDYNPVFVEWLAERCSPQKPSSNIKLTPCPSCGEGWDISTHNSCECGALLL